MEYKLLSFEIYGNEGVAFIKFEIEKKDKEIIAYNEMIPNFKSEDTALMQCIGDFIEKKVVSN